MSGRPTEWVSLFEEYARETGGLRGLIKPRDWASGRAILASSPEARTWFVLEAWRLNGADWPDGPYRTFNTASLVPLGKALLSLPLFCTPDQMQYLIWQADSDELKDGLFRNVERHLEHWGMTPDVYKMLEIKRIELARIATNKKDRARLERIDFLLGKRPETD